MTITMEHAQEAVKTLNEYITKYEGKIEGFVNDMGKAVQAKDFNQVSFYNKMITKYLSNIQESKQQVEEFQFEIEKNEIVTNEGEGFAIVIDFLEEMYDEDMKWFKGLKELSYEELKGSTKVVKMIAGLNEDEAKKLFRNDIRMRFYKLVGSVKSKAGQHILEIDLERNDNGGLDGIVKGDVKTVRLETIVAGGYNIQRAHYRTLVK